MKEKIISKTILFVAILSFITIFKKIFGEANTLVGVTILVAMLILMGKDLTSNPFRNFIDLLLLNLFLGLCATIASNNIWLGVIINFIVLALLGYFLTYNLTKSSIVPYGLQYLFMIFTPVTGRDLNLRYLALAAAPIIIMVSQFIIHSKKKEVKESAVLEYKEENDDYKNVTIFGKEFSVHPTRAAYAIRVGILTSFTALIAGVLLEYYGVDEGRWLVYTIFSLTELYSENCRVRAKKRLEGTIIGACIVVVLFMFIKNDGIRGLIILAAGYLNPFFNDYRDVMIIVTVSAVASVALTQGSIITALQRIMFVFIGVCVALIGNKFIFNNPNGNLKKS